MLPLRKFHWKQRGPGIPKNTRVIPEREKRKIAIPQPDSAIPKIVEVELVKPQEGRISALRSYQGLREREGEERRSVEIRIQEELFPRYRAWLWQKGLRGKLTVKEAIYGGSMFLKSKWGHGSADTTREWLNELSSSEGDFEIYDDKSLGPCVRVTDRALSRMDKREIPDF